MSFTSKGFSPEEFEKNLHIFAHKLQAISNQQDIICALSESIASVKDNTVILQLYMRVVEEYSSRALSEHLIPLVYLLNDFAQKSKSHAHYTSEALFNIFSNINLYHTELMAKARRCYNIWKLREIFDNDTLKKLDYALLGLTPPVPSALLNGDSKELEALNSELHRSESNNSAGTHSTNRSGSDLDKDTRHTDLQPSSYNLGDRELKAKYLSVCVCIDNVIKDTTSVREKRKIIQNIFLNMNETNKLSSNEKLLKLIEMEWDLRCNICSRLQESLNLLDRLHSEIVLRLADAVEALRL